MIEIEQHFNDSSGLMFHEPTAAVKQICVAFTDSYHRRKLPFADDSDSVKCI